MENITLSTPERIALSLAIDERIDHYAEMLAIASEETKIFWSSKIDELHAINLKLGFGDI